MNATTKLAFLGLAVTLAAAGNASAYRIIQETTPYLEDQYCRTIAYQCASCSYYWSPQTGFTPVHACERDGEWWEDYFCVARVGPWCLWFDDPPLHLPPIP